MTRDAKQIPIGPLLKGRVIVLKGKQKKEDVLNTLVDLLPFPLAANSPNRKTP